MMAYEWIKTLWKVVKQILIWGIPVFLAYSTEKNIEWALAFSAGLTWILDYLKHR